jgi:hypothetical protein
MLVVIKNESIIFSIWPILSVLDDRSCRSDGGFVDGIVSGLPGILEFVYSVCTYRSKSGSIQKPAIQ